jgi:hypothetical protein
MAPMVPVSWSAMDVPLRALLIAASLLACGDNRIIEPDAATAPAFRTPVALADDELAQQALQILGAQVPGAEPASCNRCHGLTAQRLRYWGELGDTALATCLTDLEVTSAASAQRTIDCTRAMPAVPTSDFESKKLGIFSIAARLPWFAHTFEVAYGSDAPSQLAAFRELAAMPRDASAGLTQAQFDIVAEWFVRGLPALDRTLVTDPPPTACVPAISSAVDAHVTAMATQGWRVLNAQAQLAMFGCGAAVDPRDCLQAFPRATDRGWEVDGRGTLRVLSEVDYTTSFWTRSSADGRFVAHGVTNVPGSFVLDLQRDLAIPIDAQYDPAFFPDHSGFVFQGGPRNTCPISVLTSNPASISMTEPGCRAIAEVGLYQHVGALIGGGDRFALDALFVSDDGGKLPTLSDPEASFVSTASSSFTPLIFDGSSYVPRATVVVPTPFEGDTVLSPSARLTISRLAGAADRQLGFVLREVTAAFDGSTYAIAAPEIARYCTTGGKPAFSYDERWIAFHHYIGPDDAIELGFTGPGDPAFAPYLSLGGANVYLMELATGITRRITNMTAGQYALFPHFRSDGWLYAQVRDAGAARESTIASDAALVLE